MIISFSEYYILVILTLALRKSTQMCKIHSEKLLLSFEVFISSTTYFTTVLMLS